MRMQEGSPAVSLTYGFLQKQTCPQAFINDRISSLKGYLEGIPKTYLINVESPQDPWPGWASWWRSRGLGGSGKRPVSTPTLALTENLPSLGHIVMLNTNYKMCIRSDYWS